MLRSDGRYLEAENLLLRAYEGLKATASSTTTTPTDNNSSAGSSRSDAREKQLCETARALGDLYIHQVNSFPYSFELILLLLLLYIPNYSYLTTRTLMTLFLIIKAL